MSYVQAHPGCTKQAIRKDLAERTDSSASSVVTTWKEIKKLLDDQSLRAEKDHPNSRNYKLYVTHSFTFPENIPSALEQYLGSYYVIQLQIDRLRDRQLELDTKFNAQTAESRRIESNDPCAKINVQNGGWVEIDPTFES